MAKKKTVILVEDHAIVRSGLRLILEQKQTMTVVGETGLGREAIKMVKTCRPDLVIMDIALPDISGVEATAEIKRRYPETVVLALTMYEEKEYLAAFLKAGGSGHVSKSLADRDLMRVICRLIPEAVPVSLVLENEPGNVKSEPKVYQKAPSVLSKREFEVLEQTIRGFTSREIGERLNLSTRTVETYRERIMEKLEMHHRSELIDYALAFKIF